MGWLAEINADLREAVVHQRHVRGDALYKYTFASLFFTLLSEQTGMVGHIWIMHIHVWKKYVQNSYHWDQKTSQSTEYRKVLSSNTT